MDTKSSELRCYKVAGIFRCFTQWLCWVSLFLSWELEPYQPLALVIYAIFPILEIRLQYSENGIDPSLEEAGIA